MEPFVIHSEKEYEYEHISTWIAVNEGAIENNDCVRSCHSGQPHLLKVDHGRFSARDFVEQHIAVSAYRGWQINAMLDRLIVVD